MIQSIVNLIWKILWYEFWLENQMSKTDFLFQGFVTVNGKALKKADLQADNGVIHFVSEMLEPMVTEDIPAVLTSDGRFGTLLTAIEMAGLGEMLTQSTKLYIPSTINIWKKGAHQSQKMD